MPNGHDVDDFRNLDPWRMFRIMSEFVMGFQQMAEIEPAVSIFGSARTEPDNKYYQWGVTVAKKLADAGFNIITGGGPGIMEAANKGASESERCESVGLNIDLPFEQHSNPYISKLLSFRYFFVRKVMFSKYARGIVVLPGGFGTLDEMFENLTLVQTKKIPPLPIVLMGTAYWQGLLDWVEEVMLKEEKNICPADLKLYHLTDDPDEAVRYIKEHCRK